MDKGVKKVRESIMKRKKQREVIGKRRSIHPASYLPQDEEKHGYFPSFTESPLASRKQEERIMTGYVIKGMLSIMLFFGVAFILSTDNPLFNKPKEWTNDALTEEFPFARVNQWYQTTFGSPLAFTPQTTTAIGDANNVLPVMGNVKETFQVNGTGIMIAPDEPTPVAAWRDGFVIFAGNDRETNKTVIIQHPDRSKSTYGFLSSIDVHLYQPVTNNQKIGTFQPADSNETVFFSIEKNDEYIDPVQVIKVDDIP